MIVLFVIVPFVIALPMVVLCMIVLFMIVLSVLALPMAALHRSKAWPELAPDGRIALSQPQVQHFKTVSARCPGIRHRVSHAGRRQRMLAHADI